MHPRDTIGSAEACRILNGIDRSTLSRWISSGKLKPMARLSDAANGAYLFNRSDVEALAEQLDAA